MKTILVFSPHPDDLQIAMGGTVLKLLAENTRVIEVIFSAGQKSNPHLREEVIIGKRRKQSEKASRIMNITETIYFNLHDMNLKDDVHRVDEEILALIKKHQPSTLYIPSLNSISVCSGYATTLETSSELKIIIASPLYGVLSKLRETGNL